MEVHFYCIVVINFGRLRSAAAGLLLVHLDHIVLLHLQRLRGLVIVDPPAIEQEPGDKDDNEMMAAHVAYLHWRLFMLLKHVMKMVIVLFFCPQKMVK